MNKMKVILLLLVAFNIFCAGANATESQVNDGVALSGYKKYLNRTVSAAYRAVVSAHMKDVTANSPVLVKITVPAEGGSASSVITKSSGVKLNDELAINAINTVKDTFPPTPDGKDFVLSINFRPDVQLRKTEIPPTVISNTAYRTEALPKQGTVNHVSTIRPIFSQLLMFAYPPTFRPAYENTNDINYIQESVRDGETVEKWTEMISVTGAKGGASNPNLTPERFAGSIAAGFRRACPNTYSALSLGAAKFGGYDAFAALTGCGTVSSGAEPHSESALILVIKGEKDYYTIQWAEREGMSSSPVKFDSAKWTDRLKKLFPIKVCPIVPGEPAPYLSCLNRK